MRRTAVFDFIAKISASAAFSISPMSGRENAENYVSFKFNSQKCAAVLVRHISLLACVMLPWALAAADEWQYSNVDRVVAVSDIHGAYGAMVATFQNAGVIDENLAWSGKKTHLVITGDLLDRGPDSRQVMDLIMRLEGEAESAGGMVHQLVGNHEVMNLVGDLRYVAPREYAAFADDESPDERQRWFARFWESKPAGMDELAVRTEFNKLAPPGFFGHRRALRADGHYGKWLLEKPLMVVIDGTAFVHGGIPPFVAEQGLSGVNGSLKNDLSRYLDALYILEDAEILSPIDSFYDHAAIVAAKTEFAEIDASVVAAAEEVAALNDSPIHGPDGPLWYRGTVGCGELIEGEALNEALKKIGATRVVIGHTPTITRRVLQRMNGRVIEIDTGMLNAAYNGSGNALVIEGDVLTAVNESGATISPPVKHPRRVGFRSENVSVDALADIMTNGAIIESNIDDAGRILVRVGTEERGVYAYFDELPRKKGFVPELAAYKLDRMLGLDMVPVTVRREVDGKQGTLQFLPPSAKNESERIASGQGGSAWCPLRKQWNTMYIYDALTYNPGRRPVAMLYSPENWQLMLVSHDNSFGTGRDRPAYLKKVELDINSEWLEALKALDTDALQSGLGDVLDKRQLTALGKRRDGLIDSASN